jgi:hypothetical protein
VRWLVAFGVCVVLLALTGCGGAEDETQRFAREATESRLATNAAYDTDEVHCTGDPRPWLVARQARVVICAARLVGGGCDWYRVELTPTAVGARAAIRIEAKNAGCVLPA